jgi:hypothetical protein
MKLGIITGASFFFGVMMGMFFGAFEFNSSLGVDVDRSTRSQIKQHFHGYWRHLKRQGLHFSRFGMYIGLLELPLELIIGKLSMPVIFFSGGMAAVLQVSFPGYSTALWTFCSTGCFIGGLGMYMNSGKDKA